MGEVGKVKVKVKFTLEQVTKAQRWSRGIALRFVYTHKMSNKMQHCYLDFITRSNQDTSVAYCWTFCVYIHRKRCTEP
jgi:hypothetical protein